jgi:hypothetical protein
MSNDVTKIEWATTWLTAGRLEFFYGEPVHAYGKDADGHLVAVRIDSGIRPVHNLPAVIAHRQEA